MVVKSDYVKGNRKMPEGAEIENLRNENCLNLQIEGTS